MGAGVGLSLVYISYNSLSDISPHCLYVEGSSASSFELLLFENIMTQKPDRAEHYTVTPWHGVDQS